MSDPFASDGAYRPDTPTFGIFFLLKAGADPAQWVRLWTGEHDFDMPADAVDTTGGRYISLGFPAGLPVLSNVFNGSYTSGQFSLSGVDATAIKLFGADRAACNNAPIHLGLVDFDDNVQPIAAVDWMARLIAGMPTMSRQGQSDGAIRTISLPWVAGFFNRNLAPAEYLSGQAQRRLSPDDAICDNVYRMEIGLAVPWPG